MQGVKYTNAINDESNSGSTKKCEYKGIFCTVEWPMELMLSTIYCIIQESGHVNPSDQIQQNYCMLKEETWLVRKTQ